MIQQTSADNDYLITLSSPLGPLYFGFSNEGIRILDFAEKQKAESNLSLRDLPSEVATWAKSTIGYLEALSNGKLQEINIPFASAGTPFQKRVWEALCRIPMGATQSYCEVATNIDSPSAARAVASACARNPIAILVPCHRVIRCDGTLGGYSGGLPKKRLLLQWERAVSETR